MKSLFTLNPGPWRWGAGVTAGLAMGLPLALFTALGEQRLGLVASLGGFTALYCAGLRRRERLRVLPLVGAGLVLASGIGVAFAGEGWLTVFCLILVTAVACLLTIGVNLGPPGPIMFVLVAAVSGQIANSGGVGAFPAMAIPALVALGASLAYLVVIAPLVFPAVRRKEGKPLPWAELFPRVWFDKIAGAIAARVVLGAAAASFAGWMAGSQHSHWIVLPAVAVLQASHERRLTVVRAMQRMVGTIIGVGAFGLVVLAGPEGFWLAGTIAFLQFAIEVVVARNHGLALVFITPAALTIATSGIVAEMGGMARERIVDTVAGVAIAMVVFWIWEGFRTRKSGVKNAEKSRG